MKVLIIGLGSIARKHIEALRTLEPDVELEALRSSNTSPSFPYVKDIYALPQKPDYDFIIISNPTSLHAETIKNLLDYKIPLFLEKPLFHTLGHEDIIESVKNNDILTYVACNLRFVDSLSFLHDYLKDHPDICVNEINSYCGSHLPDWRPGKDYRKSYSANPEMGGGVHLDLIHELDYICWLFGYPSESIGFFRNVSSIDIEAMDYANYLLFYPHFTASIVLNYYRRDYKRTLEIVFDTDTWLIDLKFNQIIDSKGNTVFTGKIGISDSYLCQMQYFLTLLKSRSKASNDMENAYKTLKIALNYERPEK